MPGWFGIDLDGTLAYYDGWRGPLHIGPPIPAMIMFVKQLLKRGATVKIFTSRTVHGKKATDAIKAWLVKNGLPPLEITNEKDMNMILYYDDRARQVEKNTGRIIS